MPFSGEEGINTKLMKTTASTILSLEISDVIRWDISDFLGESLVCGWVNPINVKKLWVE